MTNEHMTGTVTEPGAGPAMRRRMLVVAVMLAIAACSPRAQNEANEAAETVSADANATAREAVRDVEAARAAALTAPAGPADPAAGNDAGNVIEE